MKKGNTTREAQTAFRVLEFLTEFYPYRSEEDLALGEVYELIKKHENDFKEE